MGEYAVMACHAGAKIIGGCCGPMPEHLRHMREALDTRARGDRPSLEKIVEILGPFTSAGDGTGADAKDASEHRTRRGRRRG